MTKQLWTGTKPISGKEAEILGKTMKKALLNPKPLIRKNHDGLVARFEKLKCQWLEETEWLSDPDDIHSNRHYQQIISLGWPIVPLIIQELKEKTNHWFCALRIITGENPVRPEHRGMVLEMANDWVTWAQEKNVI